MPALPSVAAGDTIHPMSSAPSRPILGVSTAVVYRGAVLLVERAKPPFDGIWAFPGGAVEYGESLALAAAREVLEETGITVEIEAQIDRAEILPGHESAGVGGHYVVIVFRGRYVGGEPRAGDDAAAARWFRPEELPTLPTTTDTARILTKLDML